ncbi:MAG: protein kinase [Chloroflexi bacterium]|nr:protein kinase [Chloroflexota bacterium]
MSFAPGQNVGQYRIIEQLGQGGMATVFKAYHPALDRYVAIKVLHPAFKEDASFLTRFRREARIVAKLDHPNIIPIHDFAEEADTPYLVIRYIEGKTLKALQSEGVLPLEQLLGIIRPVADALAYAHTQGVLHRDIKPSNIMIANDGHVYLTDFGLARMAQAGESTLSQDMLIGTPQYISPEQAKGEPVSERSDIYSLGVVLFEMLTGRVPFNADTPYSIIHDHIYSPLPMPRAINPALSPEIERVLLRALAKEPAARYAAAAELLTAFEQAVAAMPPAPVALPPRGKSATLRAVAPTPAPIAPMPTPKRGKFSPLSCAIIGVLALLLVIVIGGGLLVARGNLGRLAGGATPPPVARGTPGIPGTPGAAQETLKSVRETLAANPNDAGVQLRLAEFLERTRDFTGAFAAYDIAIRNNNKFPNAYLRAGALAEKTNDLDKAKSYYTAGLAALPDNPDLLLQLGDVYLEQKNYDEARKQYERVIQLNSSSAPGYTRLGDYYRAMGKLAEALAQYTRALTIDSNLPEAHYGLGVLAAASNKPDEAKKQFNLVLTNSNASAEIRAKAEQALKSLDQKK